MPTPPTPSLHPSEDYEFLRREGLAHIQRLSGRLWTDFNVHDPGVTMLEILAFAVADLGFRAGHPIADILAPDSEESAELKQFFTLAEIAGSRPWSPLDYRKLLMDLPGVANGWVSRSREQEVGIYYDNLLDHQLITSDSDGPHGIKIQLNGLYEVAVRFEHDAQYGDLNDNSVRFWRHLSNPPGAAAFSIDAEIEIEFPCYRKIPKYLLDLDVTNPHDLNLTVNGGALLDEGSGSWYVNVVVWKDGESQPSEAEKFKQELRLEWRILQTNQAEGFPLGQLQESMQLEDWARVITERFIPRRDYVRSKLEAIKLALLQHRNLCEDFYAVLPMDVQEIALDMDLEVKPGTDIAALEAMIYLAVQAHLDPPVRFHSLAEMLEKGRSTDEIFDGPLLNHGFLDPQDWPQPRSHVYASDLIHIIMDLPDVVLVRNFSMRNRITGDTVRSSSRDALILTEPGRFQPVVDARRSAIRYWDGRLPIPKREDHLPTVQRTYRGGLLERIRYKGIATERDLAVPQGRNRNLDSFYSVRDEFPEAWGIGSAGLPPAASAERIKQAEQLKGYLLHFEQMLCLYLAQLRHVKHLLAVGSMPELPTYMHRVAQEVMGLDGLLLHPGEFPERLAAMVENEDSRIERRERLLDHLLARFQTSLSEAAALSWREGGVGRKDVWVMAKTAFLQDFPGLSANRAGAMDYTQRSLRCSPYSGFQRRVMGLMGWQVPDAFRLRWADDGGSFMIEVVDAQNRLLLRTDSVQAESYSPIEVMEGIIGAAARGYIDISGQREVFLTQSYVDIRSAAQDSDETALALKDEIQLLMSKLLYAANFLVVEHILLRPRHGRLGGDDLLRERLGEPQAFDVMDPWSCRLSFVFPDDSSLIDKQQHAGYRRLLQKTIREELPAHVIADFFWVDMVQLQEFRDLYRDWRKALYLSTLGFAFSPQGEAEAPLNSTGQMMEGKSESLISSTTGPDTIERVLNRLLNRFGAVCIPASISGKKSTDYKPGDVLVEVIDPDGEVVKAWPLPTSHIQQWTEFYRYDLLDMSLEGGLVLDLAGGRIMVGADGVTQALEDYRVQFLTMNAAGGVTAHEVSITIALGEEEEENMRPTFVVAPSKYDFQYRQGDVLGQVIDSDSQLVQVTWNVSGATQPPGYLALDEATGVLKVGDPEEFDDHVEGQSANPVRIPVAFITVDSSGASYHVPSSGVDYVEVKRSHRSIATPNPEMANRRPASYYANGGHYLYLISDDPDGGIQQVTGRARTPDLSQWGITAVQATGHQPRAMWLMITNLQLFLAAFDNADPVSVGGGASKVTLYTSAFDVIPHDTSLNLELVMGAEPQGEVQANAGTVWQPNLVRGELSEFQSNVLIGTFSDPDGGISGSPVVSALPSNVAWENTGLEFRLVSGASPKQALHVKSGSDFAKLVKAKFTLNGNKTSSSHEFLISTTDGQGMRTQIPVRLTVDDTPATRSIAHKFTVAQPLSAVAPEDLLMTIEDAANGGIKSFRDVNPNAPLSAWGIETSIEGGKALVRISNLNAFTTNFPRPNILNSGTGVYTDQIAVTVTDGYGFERTLSMSLQVSKGSGAYFSPVMVRGKLNAYVDNAVLGYVADPDNGVPNAPIALSPMGSQWSASGLGFVKTTDSTPRQMLKVVSGSKFGQFLEGGQGVRDLNKTTVTLTFSVEVTDGVGQKSTVPISLVVENSMAYAVKETKLDGATYLSDLAFGDILYGFQDDVDRGVDFVAANGSDSQFADWGVEQVTIVSTIPKKGLRISNYDAFKSKIKLNPSLSQLEGRMSVLATDKLGLWNAITLDFVFSADSAAVYTPSFTLGNLDDFDTGWVIGRVTDANKGVQSVEPTGGMVLTGTGMSFEMDRSKPLEHVLKVVDGPQFRRFFANGGFQHQARFNYYELRFDANVTDGAGNVSSVFVKILIDDKINTQPRWVVKPGFDGSIAPTGIQPKHLMLEIENDADGGIQTATMAQGGIVLADWGLTLTVNSAKRAEVVVFTPSKFVSKLEANPRLKDNGFWVLEMDISVTDGYGNVAILKIPVRLRVDTPSVPNVLTLPYLDQWVDGTLIATIEDSQDGGVVSYELVSAPGYVEGENALKPEIQGGIFRLTVGNQAKFISFVKDHFTLNYSLRQGYYDLVVKATDAYSGITEHTLRINVSWPKHIMASASSEIGFSWDFAASGNTLSMISYLGLYDFVSAELTQPPLLTEMGLQIGPKGDGAAKITVNNFRAFHQAMLGGQLSYQQSNVFLQKDLSIQMTVSPFATFTVGAQLKVAVGSLPNRMKFLQTSLTDVRIETPRPALQTYFDFDMRGLFPTPYGGTFDMAKMISTYVTCTKPSTYVFRLTFKEAFFDTGFSKLTREVSFTATFQYSTNPRQGPITVKFTFVPAT